jgi:nitronate monooxygenase
MPTKVTELLGIEYPIISAPMGPDLSGHALVAAVSDAGGFGILQAQFAPATVFRDEIRKTRALTSRPFGVNLLLNFPIDVQLAICLEESVAAISFFWGDPSPYIQLAHDAGVLVIHQVGSVEAALRSADAGVDVIIAQGIEAGGHVEGDLSTLALVPQVVDAVSPIPVAAAGGIADARGVAAVLALGAEAAVLGTRFLATRESLAHPEYKQRLVGASGAATVHTTLFGHGWPNAPHRTLRTAFVDRWLDATARGQESRDDEPVIGQTAISGRDISVVQFMGIPPNADSTGDIELRNLLAGQGVTLIDAIVPAKDVVIQLVGEVQHIVDGLAPKSRSARA